MAVRDIAGEMPEFVEAPAYQNSGVSHSEKVATLRQLGAFHLAHGAIDLALKVSTIAIWLAPDDPQVLRLRAHSLARAGHPMSGLKLLLQAKKSSKGVIGLQDFLCFGLAFARSGDAPFARKVLFRSGNREFGR